MGKRVAALALAFTAVAACASAQTPMKPAKLPTESLEIRTQHGPVRLKVEIAGDENSREYGLMFRKHMADDHGMIFDFPDVQPRSFWMKNTLIPLDMLFVGADGRIVSIAKQAKPLDETAVGSYFPARAVIEINGGLAEKLGIQAGDQVQDARVFPKHKAAKAQ